MTVQTPFWLLAISIIAPAVVSLFSMFIPFWLEKQKADREDARQEKERENSALAEIDHAALELLKMLSFFGAPTMRDLEVALSQAGKLVDYIQANSMLQSHYYVWESKAWEKLSVTDQEQLKKIRSVIETTRAGWETGRGDKNPYAEKVPQLVEQILALTRRSTKRE